MSDDLIQFAFTSGEQSPKLAFRADFEKYGFGLARAHNWYVDFHGGLNTRPGFEVNEVIENIEGGVRFMKFQFSNDTENSYVIILTDGKIRFAQDGQYITETTVDLSSQSASSPYTITTTGAHGYTTGDMVKGTLLGNEKRSFYVDVLSATTFNVRDSVSNDYVYFGAIIPSSAGFNRVYTLANPYAVADFAKIREYNIRDTVRLTHPSYPIKNLVRSAHASWTITDETISGSGTRPSSLSSAASGAGTAGCIYAVTAVFADGTESVPSNLLFVTNIVDFTSTAGYVRVNWANVTGAIGYRVYRSLVLSQSSELSASQDLGYLGEALATQFHDNNIVPDFTSSFPVNYNPFANEAITHVDMVTTGTGYTNASTVSISTATGSGFVAYPIVNAGGNVVGIKILNGGSGYKTTDTITVSGGTGATFSLTVSEATGNYPAISNIIQQRQIYAATENGPLTIYGSKPGAFSNFDVSTVSNASDAYEFIVDSETIAPLRHIVHMRGGMLLLTGAGIWLLSGGNDSFAITSQTNFADPQTRFGVADLPPITIDSNLLYVTDKESTARLLSYSEFSKVYGGRDMSILSSHLFTQDNPIVNWAYQETPNRLIYCTRQDGSALIFTLEIEQNIYAWTPISTKGKFKQFTNVQENVKDKLYAAVERVINGRTVGFLESMSDYDIEVDEDNICLDCSVMQEPAAGTDAITISATTGDVTITADSAIFSATNIGHILRAGGGKIVITGHTSNTVLTGSVVRDITQIAFEETVPAKNLAGEWTIGPESTTISNLHHLEGETVTILADGNVVKDLTVSSGQVTLPNAASKTVVGIGYECIGQNLPLTVDGAVIQARRKDVIGLALKVNKTRGLEYGTSLDNLYEIKERTNEAMGTAIALRTTTDYVAVTSGMNKDGQTYFVQRNPLPARVLGLVTTMEIGDDPD
jgi:hypothetical protein